VGDVDRCSEVHAKAATRAAGPEVDVRAWLVFITRQATVCERRELSTASIQITVDQRQLRTRRSVLLRRRSNIFELKLAVCGAIRVVLEDNSGINEKEQKKNGSRGFH
jgi:hypothetical protein